MSAKNFVVCDWGSTNIRAFLYLDGKQVEIKKSHEGVTTVRGKDCEGAFDRLTAEWFQKYGPMPTIMAGMVGSINGWTDAAYLDSPVDFRQLPPPQNIGRQPDHHENPQKNPYIAQNTG